MSERASQPLQVVFVDEGYRQNHVRKRLSDRACDDCRRKKKRCAHNNPSGTSSQNTTRRPTTASFSSHTVFEKATPSATAVPRDEPIGIAVSRQSDDVDDVSRNSSYTAASPSFVKFIGDLNPERELRAHGSLVPQANENSVGLWHNEPPEPPAKAGVLAEFAPASLFHHCSQLSRRLLLPLMDEECLALIPAPDHLQAMEEFYFENIHPLLPAVDRNAYHSSPIGSAPRVLQAQTLCLAAHTHPTLREHLILPHHQSPMLPSAFGRTILGAMRLNIELALTSDKVILIRTLATMSIFAYTRDALELTCQFFNRAVHLMFTIGLHQKRQNEQDEATLDGLYCYVWALDRLHAAMQGRPVAIHDRDMFVTPIERSRRQGPAFKVFINVANLLDRVIDLYRPNSTLNEVPSEYIQPFEDILCNCEALSLPSHILETLELFYHAVIILSCRSRTVSSQYGFLTPSARQCHAASQIATIVEEDSSHEIVLLPHVPYALSLSVSTAYRQVRHSRVPKSQLRARRQIHQNLRHLKSMSEPFWAAAVMAELTRKALVETRGVLQSDTQNIEIGDPNSSEDAVQREVQRTSSRRHSMYGAGYVTTNGDSSGFEWHSYPEPDDIPLLDLEASFWDYNGLEGLLDANLELSIPSFLPEGN